MTTHELRKIREEMHQSPRSMASHLGISVCTYYLWERGRPIPPYFALAVQFLATQSLPKDPFLRRRPGDASRTKFAPGARFGRLTVVGNAPPTGGSRHGRVKVLCDCGEEKGMRTSNLLSAIQCCRHCPLGDAPIPVEETTPYQPYASVSPPLPAADPDEPEIDEPDIVWRLYNDRMERKREEELLAAADELNDDADPRDDLPPLDEDWEEGL
jgi:DNA-binding XRE family transcriptional regulator